MARKKEKEPSRFNIFHHLREETAQTVIAIVFLMVAAFLGLAAGGSAGFVGNVLYEWLTFLLGIGYFLLPLLFLMLAITFFMSLRQDLAWTQLFGALLFFVSGLGLVGLIGENQAGLIGGFIADPLRNLFDVYAAGIFLSGALIISFMIMFDTSPHTPFAHLWHMIRNLIWKEKQLTEEDGDEAFLSAESEKLEAEASPSDPEPIPDTAHAESEEKNGSWFGGKKKKDAGEFTPIFNPSGQQYTPPPLSLINRDQGKPGVGDVKAQANVIKRTLQNFGIDVEMDEISIGPTVTRYALKPAEGVKLARIVGLQNDLSLALAAHPIRIEAPIPGKSLVGIEIPNQKKTTVGLGTLLGSDEFQNSDKPLLIGLGKGISGSNHYANIAKMPHALVAGATGAGKSVTIHTLVTSLLYRNSPETLKFIMVDPKRVELTLYNGIPHLLSPVITNPKNAILALKWLTKEMDRRYDILETEKVRDIQSYHKNVLEPELKKQKKNKKKSDDTENADEIETMPYIVVIIDELADIMQMYPREMEAGVVRLAQMSRAVGIHLILSTQRPSVNVITGLIKANIPARIALQVASQIDSRTILDTGGAEKLLGQGDLLYLSGEMGQPRRIQCAFISEDEVKAVVSHIQDHYEADALPAQIDFAEEQRDSASFGETILSGGDDDDEDDLYEDAQEIVISTKKASTSFLQRKLRVGYARAARLMDMLEERGVVGPSEGSKGRAVLVQDSEESGSDDETEAYSDESDISTDDDVREDY